MGLSNKRHPIHNRYLFLVILMAISIAPLFVEAGIDVVVEGGENNPPEESPYLMLLVDKWIKNKEKATKGSPFDGMEDPKDPRIAYLESLKPGECDQPCLTNCKTRCDGTQGPCRHSPPSSNPASGSVPLLNSVPSSQAHLFINSLAANVIKPSPTEGKCSRECSCGSLLDWELMVKEVQESQKGCLTCSIIDRENIKPARLYYSTKCFEECSVCRGLDTAQQQEERRDMIPCPAQTKSVISCFPYGRVQSYSSPGGVYCLQYNVDGESLDYFPNDPKDVNLPTWIVGEPGGIGFPQNIQDPNYEPPTDIKFWSKTGLNYRIRFDGTNLYYCNLDSGIIIPNPQTPPPCKDQCAGQCCLPDNFNGPAKDFFCPDMTNGGEHPRVTKEADALSGECFFVDGFKVRGEGACPGKVSVTDDKISKIWEETKVSKTGRVISVEDAQVKVYFPEELSKQSPQVTGMGIAIQKKPSEFFIPSDPNENYIVFGEKKMFLGGKGFSIAFDQRDGFVNTYPLGTINEVFEREKKAFFIKYHLEETQLKLEGFEVNDEVLYILIDQAGKWKISRLELEEDLRRFNLLKYYLKLGPFYLFLAPLEAHLALENRKGWNEDGSVDVDNSKPVLIKVTGDTSKGTWITVNNGKSSFKAGPSGITDYKFPKCFKKIDVSIPLELRVVDQGGLFLLKGPNNEPVKALQNLATGRIILTEPDGGSGWDGIPESHKTQYLEYGKITAGLATIKGVYEETLSYKDKPHRFLPEYDNTLDSISFQYRLFKIHDSELLETQINIIGALPPYTQVKYFFEDQREMDHLLSELPPSFSPERIIPVWVPPGSKTGWSQDYSEGDSEVQILPLSYGGGILFSGNDLFLSLESQTGTEIRCVPIFFEGGNVYLARNYQKENILLIGANDYLKTKNEYSQLGIEISEEEFLNILKDAFFVDRVIILGGRDSTGQLKRQNDKIFHIDQVMLPIADGLVAIPEVIGLNPLASRESLEERLKNAMLEKSGQESDLLERYGISRLDNKEITETKKRAQFTQEYNKIQTNHKEKISEITTQVNDLSVRDEINQISGLMKENGFSVISIKTDPKHWNRYQAYTNGIIFTDKSTGKKTLLMPIFPDELPDNPGQKTDYRMDGLNLENKKIFENMGISVLPVEDYAYRLRGNLHCISLLAANDILPPSCKVS